MPAQGAAILGTSPAQRSSASSQPSRGGTRSTVVPFTRPLRRNTFDANDTARQDVGSASWKGKRQSVEFPEQRGSPGGHGVSAPVLGGLRRKSDLAPLQRSVGFEAPGPANSSKRPPVSPQQPARSGSLLTRQLSQEVGSAQKASQTELQEKLEKCLQKSSAAPTTPAQPDGLAQLQDRHEMFGDPVVARAYGVAVASAPSNRLAANVAAAGILADLGLDGESVAAALLHDALDASPLTRPQLEAAVPPAVARMVGNVSRITAACQLLQADRGAHGVETATKLTTMLLAMADVRAVLIVLASRLQRLRAAAAQAAAGAADLRSEAEEGLAVFAPLAGRLGVWGLKAELEDLCFLVLHPARAKELRDVLARPQSRVGLASALGQLKDALDASGLPFQDLSGRPKNLYSVHSKLARKGATATPADIYDVRALRLVVSSKGDCYAALREVERLWRPVAGRFKDYIRTPKANGYQSLHTVVTGPDGLPIEVQIRTAKMHWIAEFGVAAHWRYKEALTDATAHTDRLIGWARWLIQWQLELEDGKTRPRGSPPRDNALQALFGQDAAGAAASAHESPAAEHAQRAQHAHAPGPASCTFPEHSPDCRFAKFVRSERFAPRVAPDHLASPVYIVLMNASAAEEGAAPLPDIQEVPAGTTVAAILAGGVPGLCLGGASTYDRAAAASAAAGLRVLVNHEEVSDATAALRHGDKVEIFAAEPAATPAPAGNVLPFRRAAPVASADASPPGGDGARNAAALPAGSPAGETPAERQQRMARQRRMLDRAFSREPSSGLEEVFVPPAVVPPGLHGQRVAS